MHTIKQRVHFYKANQREFKTETHFIFRRRLLCRPSPAAFTHAGTDIVFCSRSIFGLLSGRDTTPRCNCQTTGQTCLIADLLLRSSRNICASAGRSILIKKAFKLDFPCVQVYGHAASTAPACLSPSHFGLMRQRLIKTKSTPIDGFRRWQVSWWIFTARMM